MATMFKKEVEAIRAPVGVTGGERPGQLRGQAAETAGRATADLTTFLGTQVIKADIGKTEATLEKKVEDILGKTVADSGWMGDVAQDILKQKQTVVGTPTSVTDQVVAGAIGAPVKQHDSVVAVESRTAAIRRAQEQGVLSGAEANARIDATVKEAIARWPGLSSQFRKVALDKAEAMIYGDKQIYNMLVEKQKAAERTPEQKVEDEFREFAARTGTEPTDNNKVVWQQHRMAEYAGKVADERVKTIKNDDVQARQAVSAKLGKDRFEATYGNKDKGIPGELDEFLALTRGVTDPQEQHKALLASMPARVAKLEASKQRELAYIQANASSYADGGEAHSAEVTKYWDSRKTDAQDSQKWTAFMQSAKFYEDHAAYLAKNHASSEGGFATLIRVNPGYAESYRLALVAAESNSIPLSPETIGGSSTQNALKRALSGKAIGADEFTSTYLNLHARDAEQRITQTQEAKKNFTDPVTGAPDIEKAYSISKNELAGKKEADEFLLSVQNASPTPTVISNPTSTQKAAVSLHMRVYSDALASGKSSKPIVDGYVNRVKQYRAMKGEYTPAEQAVIEANIKASTNSVLLAESPTNVQAKLRDIAINPPVGDQLLRLEYNKDTNSVTPVKGKPYLAYKPYSTVEPSQKLATVIQEVNTLLSGFGELGEVEGAANLLVNTYNRALDTGSWSPTKPMTKGGVAVEDVPALEAVKTSAIDEVGPLDAKVISGMKEAQKQGASIETIAAMVRRDTEWVRKQLT